MGSLKLLSALRSCEEWALDGSIDEALDAGNAVTASSQQ